MKSFTTWFLFLIGLVGLSQAFLLSSRDISSLYSALIGVPLLCLPSLTLVLLALSRWQAPN